MTQNIGEALSSLHNAFHEFKNAHDERLNVLEEKIFTDNRLAEKAEHLDSIINKTEIKLRKLNMGLDKEGFMAIRDNNDKNLESKQAITQYLRKGDESLMNSICTKAALSSSTSNIGGFIMPAEITHEMNLALKLTSTMRSIARVTAISSDALEILIEKTLPNAGWATEIGDRNETDTPELEKVKIGVHALYAKPKASQQLLDDSKIDIETWLISMIAEKIAVLENQAFVSGDGENKPKGFLAYECVEKDSWEWGKLEAIKSGANGTFGDNPAKLIIDVLNSLKPQYLQDAVWVMPRSTLAEVRKIRDQDSGRYLWTPNFEHANPSTLLGYPVIVMDDMPPLADGSESKSMAFGNFKEGYQIVDRQELQVIRDPYSAKPFVEFYATKRVGGAVIDFEAIKVVNFSE